MKSERGNIESSYDYILKFNFPKDYRILDIGCNYGSLIANLSKKGYRNVYGLDIDKESIEKGKKQNKLIAKKIQHYNGDRLPYSDNSFDVILMFDVIEHIPKISEFLKREVHRVLRRGGTLVFQTPNKIINIPWEIINKKSLTKWKIYHCSLQTRSELLDTLKIADFKDIVIEKGNILTKHNKNKVTKKIPILGLPLLYLLQKLPLSFYPNFWGHARK